VYSAVLISFLVMQIFVEWKNYKIRDETVSASKVMVKTGIVTFLTVTVTSSNVILDSYYPIDQRNENFYMLKDFISFFFVFVLIPFTLVVRNPTIMRHSQQWISSARIFVQLKDITIVMNDNVLTINQYLRNTVRPAWL
jgi:hypothetical protein